MIERIKQIIEYYKLTSSSFADKIDVPRSSISHLLSGRNKPSLDFILKIEKKFSEVDLTWLVHGKGNFPNTLKNVEQKGDEVYKNDTPTLFTETLHIEKDNSLEIKVPPSDKNLIVEKSSTEKKVKRIVVLYTDGTFEDYIK